MYTVAADIMHNQRGIVAPLERCGWILLERASGEQYMYETGPKKRTQKPKTGCTCINFLGLCFCFMYMQSVVLSQEAC